MRSPFSVPEIIANERRQKCEIGAQGPAHLLDAAAGHTQERATVAKPGGGYDEVGARHDRRLRHVAYDVVRRRDNERPRNDRGKQHVEAAHSCADGIEARLEDERVEENPSRAAPDIESVLITRKRPTLARCMAA